MRVGLSEPTQATHRIMVDIVSEARNVLVIVNPVAGGGGHEALRQLVDARLARTDATYEVRLTEKSGDAFEWSRDSTADLVIAGGGDGTVMEAMSGLIANERAVPLAIIPGGTADLLARAFGIGPDPETALETAMTGVAVALDVGYLPKQDRYFALVAGAGWDAQLIGDAPRASKDRLGRFAYVASGVKNLFTLKRSRVDLEIDGVQRSFHAHTAMIFNVGAFPDLGIDFGRGVSPHDGLLDLAVVSAASAGGLARLAYQVFSRHVRNDRGITTFSASHIRITATPPLEVQIDGEPLGHTPLDAEVRPGAATIIVPIAYAAANGLATAVETPRCAASMTVT